MQLPKASMAVSHLERAVEVGYSVRMDHALEAAQELAERERMLRAVTPIIENADDTSPVLGCGTLFERHDRRFLVTAAHVIETLPSGNIALALGGRNSPLVTPGQGMLAWVRSHDIAILELTDDEFLRQLQQVGYRSFLCDADVSLNSSTTRYVLYGYPAEDTSLKNESYTSAPICLECPAFHGEPSGTKRARTPEDLFLEWTAAQGKNLEGISGAPVWVREQGGGGVWATGLKICAVETSVLADTWIRCTHWRVVDAILAKQFGI